MTATRLIQSFTIWERLHDQRMRLGWKVFLPVSLAWVVIVSGYLMLTRYGVPG